ncbi:MAG: hypothetical protein J7L72_05105 [Candidatus Aminicenantes bacterium]|nr:hypothetical protein [Candidatus Aminicenantes bacterium]
MKRIVHKAKNFNDAEKWDILQHISMTAEERQRISRLLKTKYYGKHNPDMRQRSGK